MQIHTAVSKDAGSQRVAFGIAVPQLRTHEDNRISDHSGDASWALWLVEDNKPKYQVISSDSVETFTTIEGKKSNTRPESFTEIHQTVHRINTAGCDVGFICGPVHMDVEGNEGGRSRGKKKSAQLGEKNRDGSSSPTNKASLVESVNVEKEKM